MSNLLEKASIILTPTAYSDGTLHSIKPIQTFGSELITNGDFATDSDWTLNAAWTISNGKAIYDNSASQSCEQSLNFEVGKKYLVNFEISDFTTNYRFDVYTGVSFIQSAIITNQTSYSILFDGDGGNKIRFRGLATGTGFSLDNVSVKEVINADFDFTRNTTSTRVNSSGNIESVAANLPRIDYLGGTGHILLEPQSINLVPYSQTITEFSQTNATLFDNQTISPNGTQDAGGATKLGVNANDRIRETISVSNSTVYNISAFVKNSTIAVGGVSTISFRVSGGTLFRKGYEWGASGLSFSSSQDSGTRTNEILEDYGNGWYRIGFSFTTDGTSGIFEIDLDRQNGSDTTTLFIWGAQLEEQSFATSYIPTSGSTVTRSADVCNNSGSSDLINSTSGVLYAEIAALADDNTNRILGMSNGGDFNNSVLLRFSSASNRIQAQVRLGGVYQCSLNYDVTDATEFNKIAFKYKQNDFSLFVNGAERATDASGDVIAGLDVLDFDISNTNEFYGKVKCVAVFKEALTDEELTCLTT